MMRPETVRKPRTMVARKYLCAAPHPSKWDDHAESLLKSLGGSQEKREQVIRQTLTTLEEMHAGIQKTGPGRKSNAEHAIAFYLHVLEVNKGTTVDYSEDRTNQRPNKRNRVVKDPTIEEGKDDAVEDGGDDNEKKSESSDESMDSKEFLDQHNDQCEVCNLGGRLLCCSTCNLVFHLDCVRPSLKELPKDNWSCAYCIASGAVANSRDSKTRRKAKAAVLAMARLSPRKRKQTIANDDDSDEETGNGANPSSSITGKSDEKGTLKGTSSNVEDEGRESGTTDQSVSQEEREGDRLESKSGNQALKDQNASDASKESEGEQKTPGRRNDEKPTPESARETRARRPRRQPTLYDPQLGAARKWQSDVSSNWKSKSPSSDCNKEEKNEEGETAKSTKHNVDEENRVVEGLDDFSIKMAGDSGDSIWCNFCKDDTSITICCFCACRVCFGKHDASKVLLCDNCDDEYHTFCLDPPLDAVPTSQRWFCPSCDPSETKTNPNIAGATRSSTNKTNVASKPPSPTPYGTRSASTPKKAPAPVKEERNVSEKGPEKVKRRVGRPRKEEALAQAEPVPQPARKRGRPPKSTPSISDDEEQKPRKRGRPPKSVSEKGVETPKPARKRGRPPKSRSPLSGNREMDSSSRPVKKLKGLQSPATQGTTSTRSGVKLFTSPPRSAGGNELSRASGSKSSETRFLLQTGKESIVSPISSQLNVGSVLLPSLPDSALLEAVSPKLIPRLTIPSGGLGPEHQESVMQPMSSNSSLTGPPGAVSPTKLHRSRSGRTVKRSSFHDEIEEGEQHLRSQRYALEMQRKATAVSSVDDVARQTEDEKDEAEVDLSLDILNFEEHISNPTEIPVSAITNSILKSPPQADAISNAEPSIAENPAFNNETQPPIASLPTELSIDVNPLTVAAAPLPTTEKARAPPEIQEAVPVAASDIANSQSSLGESAAAQSVAASAARASSKIPRRKPGARECMQISRRFGAKIIPQKYMDILMDYCTRGKVEHLIRMRERLDSHSRFLESQLAGLEALVKEKGELDLVVPPMPGCDKEDKLHPATDIDF